MQEQRRKLLLGGVAVAALAGAIALFLLQSRRAGPSDQYEVYGVCLACQTDAHVTHSPEETPPFVCPQCNEQAVYGWWYCAECNKRFIPRLIPGEPGGPPRRVPFPNCPFCRGPDVSGYDALLEDQPPAGDAPLPKWP